MRNLSPIPIPNLFYGTVYLFVFDLMYLELKYLLSLLFVYEDNLIALSFQYKVIFYHQIFCNTVFTH